MINSAKSYKSFILKNDNENIIKQYSIKQCSCDRAYQFSFLYDLPYPNYLEKPTSDGEYTTSTFYKSNNVYLQIHVSRRNKI